jgi:phage shock protein A
MGAFSDKSKILAHELDKLIGSYQNLRRENEELEERLKQSLKSLEKAETRIHEMEAEVDGMKVATALSGDDRRRSDAKTEVNRMLREIDKCLALIND